MNQHLHFLAFVAVCILFAIRPPGAEAASYYVDPNGSDAHDGSAPTRAWRTLERASLVALGPGERLLLRSGARFVGQLTIRASGARGRPATVGKYGGAAFPLIACEGKTDSAVEIRNPRYLVVEDLEVTNEPPNGKRRDALYGVRVVAESGGDFEGIALSRLHVHHVSGGWDRHGGAGIGCTATGNNAKAGSKRSRFMGLRIEDCCVHDVSFYGIFVSGWDNRFRDSRWYPSCQVRVHNNLLHDSGAATREAGGQRRGRRQPTGVSQSLPQQP